MAGSKDVVHEAALWALIAAGKRNDLLKLVVLDAEDPQRSTWALEILPNGPGSGRFVVGRRLPGLSGDALKEAAFEEIKNQFEMLQDTMQVRSLIWTKIDGGDADGALALAPFTQELTLAIYRADPSDPQRAAPAWAVLAHSNKSSEPGVINGGHLKEGSLEAQMEEVKQKVLEWLQTLINGAAERATVAICVDDVPLSPQEGT